MNKYLSYKEVFAHLTKLIFKQKHVILPLVLVPLILSLIFAFSFVESNQLFSFMMTPILFSSFFTVPLLIKEIKTKRKLINNYGEVYNSWKLTYLIPIYFFCLNMVHSTLMLFVYLIFFYSKINMDENLNLLVGDQLKNISVIAWIEIFFYLGYSSILGISFAYFINIFKKLNTNALIAILATVFLFNLFFIGTIPFETYYENIGFNVLSFFAIFKYLAFNGFLDSFNHLVFLFKHDVTVNTFSVKGIEILMNFTIPFILISLFISFSSSFFRWFSLESNGLFVNNVNKTNKLTYYLYFALITLVIAILVVGIYFLISVNHSKILTINYKYYLGSIFVISGIISLSILSGLLIKDIYKDKVIVINNNVKSIYLS